MEETKLYLSDAYEKYREYDQWIRKNPIKYVENLIGTKLSLFQKIELLYCCWKGNRKDKKYNKIIDKYVNKKVISQ